MGANGSKDTLSLEMQEDVKISEDDKSKTIDIEKVSHEISEEDQLEGPMITSSAEILRIPNVELFLIEAEESVPLTTGDLTILKIVQNENVIAVFAKVGDEFQWPLAKDAPVVKMDESHYIFSMKVPISIEDDEDDEDDDEDYKDDVGDHVLNYGISFRGEDTKQLLEELEKLLKSYSMFLTAKDEDGEDGSAHDDQTNNKGPEAEIEQEQPKEKLPIRTEELSSNYWDHFNPEADNYTNTFAKIIAAGTGQVVKGIFWCSSLLSFKIQKSGSYMQKHMKPNSKPARVTPKTMMAIKRVKKMSKMTKNLSENMLAGVVSVTGSLTTSLLNTKAGAKVLSMLPGEIALATLDAFVKVFEALEAATKEVMSKTTVVTCQVVSHKYGEDAAAFTKEGLSTAGHLITTAWTVTRIGKAVYPRLAAKNPTLIKGAAKAAAKEIRQKLI